MSSLTFDPVSVPRKRESKRRLNFANSQHGAAFCSSVDFLLRWRFLRNNDHTSATKYCKVKGSMRGKKWMGEKNCALTSLTV